ncbi:helix-turn-helix domain-containing protein [Clostridium sp. WILCCON 0269]|uniref:Helix-turn-helix domain-containing protein n=1 Tax=Candidatus Clostridium eludens TaxID=3381663 RepID=A0ABW8SQD4_9CLOT
MEKNFMAIHNDIVILRISNRAYRIYSFLNSMCFGKKDKCFPSQSYIAKKLRICVRTIQRGLKELVQAGLIKVKRRGSMSNVYYILDKVVLNSKLKNKDNSNENNSKGKSKIGSFDNFKPREYDFNDLEKKLLGWDDEEDLKE